MDPQITELQRRAAERADVVNLAGGLPAAELLPRADLARALAEVAVSEDALQYGWPEGMPALRSWIAARLAARGLAIDPDAVIVTAGAQQALGIAARIVGGAIGVGDATYHAAIDAFAAAGARAVVDGDARYVIAGVANPQGVALPVPAGAGPLVVDEAYVDLRFDGRVPAPRIGAGDWLVGTVSKTIAPGLRVGWLIAPAEHRARALALKQAADLQTASLSQAALVRLLERIDHDALIAHARAAYARGADALVHALRHHVDGIRFAEPEGGFSIWIETDDRGDELALARAALDRGVMFDPGSLFCPEPRDTLALRVSFSHAPPGSLDAGARRLGLALAAWRRQGVRLGHARAQAPVRRESFGTGRVGP